MIKTVTAIQKYLGKQVDELQKEVDDLKEQPSTIVTHSKGLKLDGKIDATQGFITFITRYFEENK